MSVNQKTPEKFETLRQQAEKLIHGQPEKTAKDPDDILELIHELRIHQTELEIQNEELRRAQQEISDLQYKYEDLYEFAPCGYLTLNPKGIITQANLMAVKLLKTVREVLLRLSFTNFIEQAWEDAFFLARKKASLTGEKQSIQLPLKAKTDQPQWLQVEIEAERDENEELIQWRMVLFDVTLQKQAKEAYKQKATEMEALYIGTKLLLEEDPFEITARKIFNICCQLTGAKAGYVALLSRDGTENELLFLDSGGLPCDVDPELPMPIRGLRAEAYKDGKVVFDNDFSNSEWMQYMPDKHVTLENVLFAPLKENGKSVGLIGLANKTGDFNDKDVRTITGLADLAAIALKQSLTRRALKESQQQFLQSQKMEAIGTLAGGIAHDFNNMLGVITGNLSYALSQMKQNDALHDVLIDVQEAAKQAKNLTQQLLTFSMGGEPIKKVIQLNQLIQDSSAFVVRGGSSKCKFMLAPDLWRIEADSGQLNQVISNLVINADQAMPNGGVINIQSENFENDSHNELNLPAGKYIRISIQDQGVGIQEKYISRIFEPYFTTKQKGSGLGLATVYSIIKRHGGYIKVFSEIGKGTVFHIYLPASEKNVQEFEKKQSKPHVGDGKILIMDDQEAILKMAKRMLDRMGYNIEFALDGSEAIKKYRDAYLGQHPFDLVILDLTVPGGLGGTKTIIELLKIDSNVKAVVSSGYSNDPIMSNYADYGFCGVIPKPYSQEQLCEVLNKIFGENS